MKRWRNIHWPLALVLALVASPAVAQGGGASSTGSIAGEVKDTQGGSRVRQGHHGARAANCEVRREVRLVRHSLVGRAGVAPALLADAGGRVGARPPSGVTFPAWLADSHHPSTFFWR